MRGKRCSGWVPTSPDRSTTGQGGPLQRLDVLRHRMRDPHRREGAAVCYDTVKRPYPTAMEAAQ